MNNPLNLSAPLYYLDVTDSTMLEARRLVEAAASSGQPVVSGTVIQAGEQTAGRGRLKGRRWDSAAGDSLMFTVIFTKTDLASRMGGRPFTLLPLLCGLAVAEAVEQFLLSSYNDAADIQIKWPNDVLAGGRKLCGILCEAAGDYLYAGIGVNLNQTAFSGELRRPACSVRMLSSEADEQLSGERILELVLERLDAALENEDWRQAVEQRMYRLGEIVKMLPGLPEDAGGGVRQEEIVGYFAGLNNSGAVTIDGEEQTYAVVSGELLI